MTHHRPKSPSPAQLPPVGDTVVGLDPVADTGSSLKVPAPGVDTTTPELPGVAREITSPMEIPQHLRVPGLNQATTPGTPMAIAAPQLAAKLAHSDLHRAHEPSVAEVPPAVTPLDPVKALGPAFDEMTFREAPAPAKKHDSGPKRSHPDVPARKSRTDHRAISDVPTGPPRKSLTDVPAQEISDVPTGPPRKSLTDVPALSGGAVPPGRRNTAEQPATPEAHAGPLFDPNATVRKSRTDVPALIARGTAGSGEKKAAARGSTGNHAAHASGPKRAAGPITAPFEVPAPLDGVTQLQSEQPASTPQHPAPALNGRTVMRTLPSVPPVLPFGGIEDPRFKRGAMIAGLLVAVVAMALVSWALLKHEPSMPAEDALKPAFVELPAPPRKDEPDEAVAVAASPKLPMIEVQLDGGKTALVPAGILKVFSDPDCTVFANGRELGPTPAAAQLPAGKITLALVNTKIGLHMVETVELKPGETKNAEYSFAPGFLEVVADDDAKLTVDGRPVKPGSMQVWQGNHRVEALYGHEKVAKSAQVLAGATTTVELRPP